jgi:hypothetical protein
MNRNEKWVAMITMIAGVWALGYAGALLTGKLGTVPFVLFGCANFAVNWFYMGPLLGKFWRS